MKNVFLENVRKTCPRKNVPVFHAQARKYYSLYEAFNFQEVSQEKLKYWRSYGHLNTRRK